MTQITDLVREAMGFSKERGDSLNVVNARSARPRCESVIAPPPIWRDWLTMANLRRVGEGRCWSRSWCCYLCFGVLRPTLRDLTQVGARRARA